MHNEKPSPQVLTENPQSTTRKRKKWPKVLLICIVVLLLGLAGWLAWQLKQCRDQHAKDQSTSKSLQKKVSSLTKQLKDAQAKSAVSSSAPATPTCPGATLTADLKDNLAAAISSRNTAALEGYMASSVNVVFAGSEKAGAETPAQAVADMDYLNTNATAPWDFNISNATISSYKAGFYGQYFDGTIYVGVSSNKYLIAYGFDDCTKINRIFVAASTDLL